MLSVQEYAREAGVSAARVYQLIDAGEIPAQKIARFWVIDDVALRRVPMSRRPLSRVMARLVLDVLAGVIPAGIDSRRRLRAEDHAVAIRRSSAPAALLRDLMRNRAHQVNLRVHPEFLAELRADDRISLSGIDDLRSKIDAGSQLEGHVRPEHLSELEADFLLIEHPEPNVRLHISDRSPLISDSIADLADWSGPREDAEAARMLAEELPR